MIAPAIYDTHLRLALSQRSPLLKTAVVAAHRGISTREIYEEVAAGTLRWVFNLATSGKGAMPDYRFWSHEIAGEDVHRVRVETVIREILGMRGQFRSGELCILLSISRPTLKLLRAQLGGRLGRRGSACAYFERAGVERFLRNRLHASSIPAVGKKSRGIKLGIALRRSKIALGVLRLTKSDGLMHQQ